MTNTVGISFELISPSNVVVGSYPDEIRRKRNETIKNVQLSRHFIVSKFAIAESQFFSQKVLVQAQKNCLLEISVGKKPLSFAIG